MSTDAWGIDDGYADIAGAWHATGDDTRRSLRVAMGGLADVEDPPPAARPVWLVRQGSGPRMQRPCELVLEDGTHVHTGDDLPPDLPLGYHDLHPNDGGTVTRLIITPQRAHLPEGLRTWGWSAQLYAARSRSSWGIGDLGDLGRLGDWSRSLGAGLLAINPLHAPLPVDGQESSPYFPSSRLFRSPLYLRVEDVPGYDAADPALAAAATAGRALNAERLIDRDLVHRLKRDALTRLWSTFDGDPRFDAYVADQGELLWRYGTFAALAEHHGRGWSRWPAEHRRPEAPGVARFAEANLDRVRFHQWVQWLLDEQLAVASTSVALLGDLAVGVDADGFDAWLWRDCFATGISVGAPPDAFNAEGQDWGLPPFIPWRLRAAGYEPFALTVRSAMRHFGALRIDHVMGLLRLFWIPDGASAAEGAYVRFADRDLLDIVALESARSSTVVVGEDLGTVEDGVRDDLVARGLLSYRLGWFEEPPPERWPRQALAAVTTHDLPTVAGAWGGTDGDDELRQRLAALAGDPPSSTSATDVATAAYARLAAGPSMIVAVGLDDAIGVVERTNVPGTTSATRPNWSIALPEPLEAIENATTARGLAAAVAAHRSTAPTTPATRPAAPTTPAARPGGTP